MKMKTIPITFLALTLGLNSCSTPNQTASNSENVQKPSVIASYSVLCNLTETIAQDTVNLKCLIPPAQDPHTYQPTPSDSKAISEAQLVLYGGYQFEPQIIELVQAANTPTPKIAVSEQAVPKPIMAVHEHAHEQEQTKEEHKEGESEPDPHVWHDVKNVIAMTEIVRSQLATLNPSQAQVYDQNAKAYTEKLQNLDNWVKAQIATIPEQQRTLITTHDALGYYINAYGLTGSEALQGMSTEETPTASRVKELVGTIKQTKVPTLFAEITANNKVIENVAREANVKIADQELYADSLGEKGSPTGTYVGMIENNTCAIVNGLGGKCTPFQ
ncbi:metal ABC transporter substrate-binding protein [Aphanothece hegewaldii CCALA 016]|uniref:Metal ABC transporter substrate-binding protein n=2 Tax=Aphanothece TaxID=1121 RepID=A0A2T1M0U7_9CHRO|nr:metal ABC transporter substrate-binding protein [Aphanothece hegewaldii CCALA 016]